MFWPKIHVWCEFECLEKKYFLYKTCYGYIVGECVVTRSDTYFLHKFHRIVGLFWWTLHLNFIIQELNFIIYKKYLPINVDPKYMCENFFNRFSRLAVHMATDITIFLQYCVLIGSSWECYFITLLQNRCFLYDKSSILLTLCLLLVPKINQLFLYDNI